MAKLVHRFAAKYHHSGNQTRDLINATMQLKSQSFFAEALVSSYQGRSSVLGVPRLGRLDGFTIDAKSKQAHVQAIAGADAGQVTDFMMLAGLEGSYQERDNVA